MYLDLFGRSPMTFPSPAPQYRQYHKGRALYIRLSEGQLIAWTIQSKVVCRSFPEQGVRGDAVVIPHLYFLQSDRGRCCSMRATAVGTAAAWLLPVPRKWASQFHLELAGLLIRWGVGRVVPIAHSCSHKVVRLYICWRWAGLDLYEPSHASICWQDECTQTVASPSSALDPSGRTRPLASGFWNGLLTLPHSYQVHK